MSIEELAKEIENCNEFLESLDYYEKKLSYAQDEWSEMLGLLGQSGDMAYAGMRGRLAAEYGVKLEELLKQCNSQGIGMENLRDGLASVGAAVSSRIKELQDELDRLEELEELERMRQLSQQTINN